MSRFASLPLAVRLATAFGLQAIALLLVTVLALEAFGSFKHELHGLSKRDVRAVSLAGEIGQHVQAIGRLATEHVYVYDGDLANQDRIAGQIDELGADAEADAAKLAALAKGNPNMTAFTAQVLPWSRELRKAIAASRAETVRAAEDRSGSRDIYTRKISPEMEQLFATMNRLQDSIERSTEATVAGVKADEGACC